MKTEIKEIVKKDITITLNEEEAFVLQNVLNSFQWGAAGGHFFYILYNDLRGCTGKDTLTSPVLDTQYALANILKTLPGSNE